MEIKLITDCPNCGNEVAHKTALTDMDDRGVPIVDLWTIVDCEIFQCSECNTVFRLTEITTKIIKN